MEIMQFTVKCIEFPTRAYQIIFNRDIKQTFIYRSNSKNNQNWAQQTTAMNTGFHGNENHRWIFTNLLTTSTVCMLLNPDTIPLIPSKLCWLTESYVITHPTLKLYGYTLGSITNHSTQYQNHMLNTCS